jgi:hypothetical protein
MLKLGRTSILSDDSGLEGWQEGSSEYFPLKRLAASLRICPYCDNGRSSEGGSNIDPLSALTDDVLMCVRSYWTAVEEVEAYWRAVKEVEDPHLYLESVFVSGVRTGYCLMTTPFLL